MTRKPATKTKKASGTKKKASTRKKAQPNMESLSFADGKTSEETLRKAQDIEDLISHQPANPFQTMDYADFEKKVGDMNLSQMQEMAVSASIFPSGNRTGLKGKLLKEFKTRFGTKGAPRYQTSVETPAVDPESDVAREVRRILNS